MERPKVLVVDDDESILEYLQTSLELLGYEPTAVSTATEAIGILRAQKTEFPVVLTDIMMPGITGLELLRFIRKSFSDTQVIMLTAIVSGDTAIQALNEGAFAYITKPVNPDELKATLKNAYGSYRLVRENRELAEQLSRAKGAGTGEGPINMVLAFDTDGAVKRLNRAVEGMTGYTEGEARGMSFRELFTEGFVSTGWGDLSRVNRVSDFPVSFRTKDGREVTLRFTGTVMKNSESKVLGLIGTGRP